MDYFPIIIALCLNFLTFQRVISSQNLSFNNLMLPNDMSHTCGIYGFFSSFKKSYIEKRKPRHIMVLGANNEDVKQARPLLENYPHVIYTDTKDGILYRDGLSRGNLVVVFLRDLTEKTFEKNVAILLRCIEGKVLFVSGGRIHVGDIWLLFTLAARINLAFPEFAHVKGNVIKLYSHFMANNCSMEVRLMVVWKPGVDLNNINDWAFRPRSRNGCPVPVSTSYFEPKMILESGENGSLNITGGIEGNLILAVAEKLNFTLDLRLATVTEGGRYSQEEYIIKDIMSERADLGIGRLRPTNDINRSMVEHSSPYDYECITWGVPRIMKWSNNVLVTEFNWRIWGLVGLVFVIGCTIGYYFEKFESLEDGNRKKIAGFVVICLDTIAIHLENPAAGVPTHARRKFLLLAFLYYATVLTTAYKTFLASILTTESGTLMIVDVRGIIDANLDVGGSRYDFDVLKVQAKNSKISMRLVKRFKINNNHSENLQRLMHHQDFAFLTRASSLREREQKSARDHESVNIHVFNRCVLFYPTVLVVRRKTFMRSMINNVIQRLLEAGLLEYWSTSQIDADKILKRRSLERFFEDRAGDKLRYIFYFYFYCNTVCVLIFLIELILPKINLCKPQRPANLLLRYLNISRLFNHCR